MPKEEKPIKYVKDVEVQMGNRKIDGRNLKRKSVADDKALNITASGVDDNAITQAKMADNAVGKAEVKYETATLAFNESDTSKTATVTVNSIVIGFYVSAITGGPAFADLKLSISSTTLTGTRAVACGAGTAVTYTIILLKA